MTERRSAYRVHRNKFNASKTVVDGITFDSAAEARRYGELKLREKAGEISDLGIHRPFSIDIEGEHICNFISDFDYWDCAAGHQVIEDVKSEATRKLPTYRLKKNLVHAIYHMDIVEVAA